MGTLFILWACGILFLVVTACAYFDEPDFKEKGSFTYPLNYRLPLRHRWCRILAKVALVVSAILTLSLPFFGDDIIQFRTTPSDLLLDISVLILAYMLLAVAWVVAQVLVTIAFLLVVDIAKTIWRVLKEFITWIVK